jgi:hypothetical protein
MNATAEMQWRSPVYRSFNSLKSALRLPQNQFEDLLAGLLPHRGSGSIDYFLFADDSAAIQRALLRFIDSPRATS